MRPSIKIIENKIKWKHGKSAYETAVAGGYTGTEAQFNAQIPLVEDLPLLIQNAAAATTAASGAAAAATTAASGATTAVLSAGYLGSIAYNAAAPTPAKNGWYDFSTGGVVSWLTGTPTVKIGDRVSVLYTAPSTYLYTYQNTNLSGVLVPKSELDIYNVTIKIPLAAGQYYTATTARAAVPTNIKKLGLKITYATAISVWMEETYIGADLSGWDNYSNWLSSESKLNAYINDIYSSNLGVFDQPGVFIYSESSGYPNANYKISFFQVTPGKRYRIQGQVTSPAQGNGQGIGAIAFYTTSVYGSGIAGTCIRQVATGSQSTTPVNYDLFLVAPNTATYVGITQYIGTDTVVVTESISSKDLKSSIDINAKDILRTESTADLAISMLTNVVTPTYNNGYVIPNFLYPEADANYKIAQYPVVEGKLYRLRAQVTAKAVGAGVMGAYCFYNNLSSPTNGGITVQTQLTTKIYDVQITIPAGVTYLMVSEKLTGGDYNSLSEIVSTPYLKGYIDLNNANILGYLCSSPLTESVIDGLVLWTPSNAISNANYKASFYPVVAGKKYRIKGQFTTPDINDANIAVYCFYTSVAYSSGIAGTLVNQKSTVQNYDVIVTAPAGANYIGITQLKSADNIAFTQLILQEELKPIVDKSVADILTNSTNIESNFNLLSRVINPVFRNGYVIPNYLWEEADANYKVAKYAVEAGKSYRLRAQVTAKAVAQGTMGAYCWFTSLEVPMTGGNTVLTQLTTKTYDLIVTCPVGATYLNVSQKLTGGDYNSVSELISASSLKDRIDKNFSDNITCWGDSITWGAAPEDGLYWTLLLQGLIGTSKKVINCGVGGESAVNIPMRQGGIPMYNSIEFTLPSDTSLVPVGRYDNWFYSGFFKSTYDDSLCSFLVQGPGRDMDTINPCYVDGIECTLSYSSESTNPIQGQYYIKRNVAGTARTIKVGTTVYTNAAKNLKQGATVLFIGTNDGWIDATDLIIRYKKMIEFANCGKNYIIVGIYGGTAKINHNLNKAGFEALEKAMVKEFGLHYINLRKYCVEHGLSDAGITPTTADNSAIALGDMPPSLLADSVHPNAAGSRLIANLIYKTLINLGII